MRRPHARSTFAILLSLMLAGAGCAPEGATGDALPVPLAGEDALHFSVVDGRAANEFYRAGPVAAHLVFTSGMKPRFIAAFPAGNSGVSLWFEPAAREAAWRLEGAPRGVMLKDEEGRTLYGVGMEATLEGPMLIVDRAVLGNVRSIRDYGYAGETPSAIDAAPSVRENRVVWRRARLDGGGGYYLSVQALEGSVERREGKIAFVPSENGRLRLWIAALTGDEPLAPIPLRQLLDDASGADPRALKSLAFLSYREKLLAGSWRFLTYFGRDTLLSLKMLAPAASPALMEAGLASVIERLNENGEVAHEEDLAEYAWLRRRQDGEPPSTAPIYDYAMIDDDFLLAPLAADYLLDSASNQPFAAAFLERRTQAGEPYGAALVRNLAFVVASARPFAENPDWRNLIHLRQGKYAGEWRDSPEGLGGGRTPYDVNAVLVPAALRAAGRLYASGLLAPYAGDRAPGDADALAAAWESAAPPIFRVHIDARSARARVESYAAALGVPARDALASLNSDAVLFNAVALDERGAPIPVLNSDESFLLAFSDPPPARLEAAVDATMRPFPAGLLSPAGLLVANAAYAPSTLQSDFSNNHYHGAVVWSWQQALFASGLARQLRRDDLDAALRAKLEAAERDLWRVIEAGEAVKTSELWSWSMRDGAFVIEPFGQQQGDADESNAAQLWSTVYLAVKPPS